jgi:hypothetical protein
MIFPRKYGTKTEVFLMAENVRFTVGGRTYELVPFVHEGDDAADMDWDTLVNFAKVHQAYLGEEDGRNILEHQAEIITDEVRGAFHLIFPAWSDGGSVDFLNGDGCSWERDRDSTLAIWDEDCRLVRRIS